MYRQLKNVYHFIQAQLWRMVYGWPDRALTLYGVTGTNGKTTTSYVLDSILAQASGRHHVGMLTTVLFRNGEQEAYNTTKMTTLPSGIVYRKLAQMRRTGVSSVVLEMTSHALAQHRLAGIRLDGAILLNIEREHLDYHGTMERYAAAKARIVHYLKDTAPLVAKQDDVWVRRVLKKSPVIWFAAADAQTVATPLPGDVNKENVLAATLLARAIGIDEAAIAAGIQAVRQVPGRMEWVAANVLIDYAVTPGALDQLYRYVRGQTNGKIFAVLGAAGLRDRGKRLAMAQAVAQYADEIVLTREDPWTEDEEQIFKDLEQGLAPRSLSGVGWRRIPDRREAIRYCLTRAKPEDIVVITGKGAERSMAVGKNIIPWNDKEVILQLLQEKHKALRTP